ncbi:MAG: hypothetical protein C0424_06580 [Sphingobacteriaceae bacterium]|nr:hypothetical protein [Sphingobacteriaceae bacterium]
MEDLQYGFEICDWHPVADLTTKRTKTDTKGTKKGMRFTQNHPIANSKLQIGVAYGQGNRNNATLNATEILRPSAKSAGNPNGSYAKQMA